MRIINVKNILQKILKGAILFTFLYYEANYENESLVENLFHNIKR